MKTCNECGQKKDRSEFYPGQGHCKKCNVARNKRWRQANPEAHRLAYVRGHVRRLYGLSWQDYTELFDRQKGRCALCGSEHALLDLGGLCVDHDHETGRVRGLLCKGCNSALGALGDTIPAIRRVLSYLETSKGQPLLEG